MAPSSLSGVGVAVGDRGTGVGVAVATRVAVGVAGDGVGLGARVAVGTGNVGVAEIVGWLVGAAGGGGEPEQATSMAATKRAPIGPARTPEAGAPGRGCRAERESRKLTFATI